MIRNDDELIECAPVRYFGGNFIARFIAFLMSFGWFRTEERCEMPQEQMMDSAHHENSLAREKYKNTVEEMEVQLAEVNASTNCLNQLIYETSAKMRCAGYTEYIETKSDRSNQSLFEDSFSWHKAEAEYLINMCRCELKDITERVDDVAHHVMEYDLSGKLLDEVNQHTKEVSAHILEMESSRDIFYKSSECLMKKNQLFTEKILRIKINQPDGNGGGGVAITQTLCR